MSYDVLQVDVAWILSDTAKYDLCQSDQNNNCHEGSTKCHSMNGEVNCECKPGYEKWPLYSNICKGLLIFLTKWIFVCKSIKTRVYWSIWNLIIHCMSLGGGGCLYIWNLLIHTFWFCPVETEFHEIFMKSWNFKLKLMKFHEIFHELLWKFHEHLTERFFFFFMKKSFMKFHEQFHDFTEWFSLGWFSMIADTDECSSSTLMVLCNVTGNGTACINTAGSYQCTCPYTHIWDVSKTACVGEYKQIVENRSQWEFKLKGVSVRMTKKKTRHYS
jgi:hypothetical protein